MSNEARKNPAAGRRYGSLTGQFIEIKNKLQEELGREPAEFDVINEMYMAKNLTNKNKLRALQTKEILFSILLENIKYNHKHQSLLQLIFYHWVLLIQLFLQEFLPLTSPHFVQ